MAEQICPSCYRLLAVTATECRYCGASLGALSARAFHDKLMAALNHPLDDIRLRAITALNLRGDVPAADALVDCALRHPTNVTEGLSVVAALAHFGAPARESLMRLASRTRNHAVQVAATEVLAARPVDQSENSGCR